MSSWSTAEPEVALTFVDETGRQRRVVVAPGRFTIGRGPDNHLSIRDSNLSRQHAVIETERGSPQISDCGSHNGTLVNDYPLVGVIELCDGDRVTLGGAVQLAVSFSQLVLPAKAAGLTPPLMAGAAVTLLLLVAGGLLIVSSAWGELGNSSAGAKVINNQNSDDTGSAEVQASPSKSDPTPGQDGTDAFTNNEDSERIGRGAKRVMSKISNDSEAFIPETGMKDIARKVEEYRGSSRLAEKFREVKRGCPEITEQAQGINLKPALVMYAALAESEGSTGGDPVASARRMMPKLLTLRATFGTETANSSLLLVAAFPYPFNPPIGGQARTPHPLASKLMEFGGRKSTVDTAEARSVWFLREKNGITDEAYDLVIRLLAIGVIAQNPRQYGIEADPPIC